MMEENYRDERQCEEDKIKNQFANPIGLVSNSV
jgi:hypothetical protein